MPTAKLCRVVKQIATFNYASILQPQGLCIIVYS
nr:MAG TPA: hypothetical protein [Caudoviricetes sp.]